MDLTRIDDHDVARRAVVGRVATRESLHAMQRHADGVGVVRVAVIRERVERGFQQLDALTPAGPAHTFAASHPRIITGTWLPHFLTWLPNGDLPAPYLTQAAFERRRADGIPATPSCVELVPPADA